MIWFTSDTHFGHANVLKFSERPWNDIDDMSYALIENINACVEPSDELYILGDFSFKLTVQQAYELRKLIRCKKIHLVHGNHDKDWRQPEVANAFIVEPPIKVLKNRRRENRDEPLPHGRLAIDGTRQLAHSRAYSQPRVRL